MKRSSAQKEREALVRKQWENSRKTSTSANCGSIVGSKKLIGNSDSFRRTNIVLVEGMTSLSGRQQEGSVMPVSWHWRARCRGEEFVHFNKIRFEAEPSSCSDVLCPFLLFTFAMFCFWIKSVLFFYNEYFFISVVRRCGCCEWSHEFNNLIFNIFLSKNSLW